MCVCGCLCMGVLECVCWRGAQYAVVCTHLSVCLSVYGWVFFPIVTLLIGLCLTDMESGERLVSPAPTLSAARTSSPAASSSSSSSSSSPAPHSKSSLAPSPSALGSTLSASGKKQLCQSSVSETVRTEEEKYQHTVQTVFT